MQNNESLRARAESFLIYKRGIGHIYKTQEHYLMNYVAYAESTSIANNLPDKETVTGYLNCFKNSPGSLYNAAAALRGFGKHLAQQGFNESYVIPEKSSPSLDYDPPYFFSADEITRFFKACDRIDPHLSYPGREMVFPALFRLMYCCGLRCKEVRTLLHENVNLSDRFLDVIQSKGPKSRRVFISEELAIWLKGYDESIIRLFPKRKYFFPHKTDTCYEAGAVSNNFKRFWMKAFPGFVLKSRPRAYDLRHHFVWANLNRWAKEGIDVNVMLPYLVRYMGHQNIKSTLYYFRFVPDFYPTFSDMAEPLESILPEVPYEE